MFSRSLVTPSPRRASRRCRLLLMAACAATSLAGAGCASRSDVRQLRVEFDAFRVEQSRQRAEIASLRQELHALQGDLAARLARALDDVNAGVRRAEAAAQRHWDSLAAVQDELQRMGALHKRFKPVRHGSMWILVASQT